MLTLDDSFHDIRMPYISSWIYRHHRREGQLHRPRMETTEIIREYLWEHRDHLARSIDARSPSECLTVECGSLYHIFGDISDMDGERIVSVLFLSDRNRIIEILGV